MKMSPKSRTKRQINKLNRWKEVMLDWQQSGMKQREYCYAKQISHSTFKNWRSKIKQDKSQNNLLVEAVPILNDEFIPVNIKETLSSRYSTPNISRGILIKTKQGHELSLSAGFDEEMMIKLLRAFRLSEAF